MTAFNIIAESIVLFAETSAIKGIEGTGLVRTLYILLGIVSFVLAALQVRNPLLSRQSPFSQIDVVCQGCVLLKAQVILEEFNILTLNHFHKPCFHVMACILFILLSNGLSMSYNSNSNHVINNSSPTPKQILSTHLLSSI